MQRISKALLPTIFFTVGVAAGYHLAVLMLDNVFVFSNEIAVQFDPINILSLITTIFLAIYVTRELNSKNEQDRVEKDLLIENLKSFDKKASDEVRCLIRDGKVQFTEVTAKLKTLRMGFNSLARLAEKYSFIKKDTTAKVLDDKIRDIKDLLTDTPNDDQLNGGEIIVSAGELTLGSKRREDVEIALNELGSKIFELIVEINRK